MLIDNNTSIPKSFQNDRGISALKNFLSSENWNNFLQSFSHATGFHFTIYDENNNVFSTISENPICKIIESGLSTAPECPASCIKLYSDAFIQMKPATHKCIARVTYFTAPIQCLGEKFIIVGKNGFTSYEDFLGFLKIAKENKIYEIPVDSPVKFHDENYLKNISSYFYNTVNYILKNIEEKQKLTEKIGRFAALSGTNIIEKLVENTDALGRYIVDTIEFLIPSASVALTRLDKQTSQYQTKYASGRYRNNLMNLWFNAEDPFITALLGNRDASIPEEIQAEKLISANISGNKTSLFLFPFYFTPASPGLLAILNKELSQEDVEIINAFRDYIESALKKNARYASKDKKLESLLSSIIDSSVSLAPLLNWDKLLQTIVERAVQLLRAEQGSLMLLNQNTSDLIVEAKKSQDDIPSENMKIHQGEGIAGKVLEQGEPLLVEDLEKDPRINRQNKTRYNTKSFISIPLKIENRVLGVLNISDKINRDVFTEDDLRLLQSFATNASIAIERSMFYKKTEELKEVSMTDPLTGVYNRRYLNNRLSEEISRFNRYKHPFSILMIDVDEFKKFNDLYGHSTGDMILRILASTILSSLRNIDIAVRFGGDEFILLLPQTPKLDAITIGNRILENIEKAYLSHQDELPISDVTVSVGLASFPDDATSAAELLEKTDQALYLAKKGGKNRLVYL
jgi:diguanylate cyclase (GGDEF)-like protein